MKATIIVLAIATVILSMSLVFFKKQHDAQIDKNMELDVTINILQHTIEALQQDDIQRLIDHVTKVMSGEIVYERGTNPLSRYSYSKNIYPTMHRIEVDLSVLEIALDGDSGEIRAVYSIHYYNASGETVRYASASMANPTRWTLERQGEDWVIVDIFEHP